MSIPRPMRGKIFITPEEKMKVSPGGIIIPDQVMKTRANRGKVVAVGEGVSTVKVGDEILFGKYAYKSVKFEDQELLVMDADSEYLLAVLEA